MNDAFREWMEKKHYEDQVRILTCVEVVAREAWRAATSHTLNFVADELHEIAKKERRKRESELANKLACLTVGMKP